MYNNASNLNGIFQRIQRIEFTDHDLMQLFKTSERKMVTYNIALNLNGIFRRVSKATERKIDCKKPSG